MEKIKDFLSKNKAVTRSLLLIRRFFVRIYMRICWLKPIEKNKVVFINFSGRGFGDNGKPIALKLMELFPEADIVWATKPGNEKSLPQGIRSVPYQTPAFYKEMATANVWLNNCRMSKEIIKREGQLYFHLWHGGVSMKKIEKDTEHTLEKTYAEHAKYDSTIADYIISGSGWFTNVIKTAFWYDGEVLECGTPRLDPLFVTDNSQIEQVRSKAGFPQGKKVALYLPTFRYDLSTDCYSLDFDRVIKELEEKFGGEFVIAVRLHPNAAKKADFIQYNDRIINATPYPDLYELFPLTDVIITDYSTVMFEGGMMDKPVFLFATDIDEYIKDRELYFDIRNLPFSLAENNDELADNIKAFDEKSYLAGVKELNRGLDYHENGTASKTITERIIGHING